jgi:hypothetical protein
MNISEKSGMFFSLNLTLSLFSSANFSKTILNKNNKYVIIKFIVNY